jgi:hypothetical protein
VQECRSSGVQELQKRESSGVVELKWTEAKRRLGSKNLSWSEKGCAFTNPAILLLLNSCNS